MKTNSSPPGKKVTRRQFIKTAARSGLAAGLALKAPFVHAGRKIEIRFLSSGVAFHREIAERAKQDLGVTVRMEMAATTEESLARAISHPRTIDLMDIDYGQIKLLLKMKRIRPIETKRLAHVDNLSPVFTHGGLGGRRLSRQGGAPMANTWLQSPQTLELAESPTDWMAAVPTVFNADTLGVRPDRITKPVAHWKALLDPEFSGRAALINTPHIGILDAAMALESMGALTYKDKGNMTREEIDGTIARLIEARKRGQFYALWNNFNQSVDLMASGKVVIQSMWAPAVTKVRQMGIPCVYQPLEEGYRGWCYGLVLSRALSGARLDAVHEFINWYQSGWVGAFLNRQGFYSSVPATARQYMQPHEWDYWIRGKPASRDITSPAGMVIEKKGAVRDGGDFTSRIGGIAVWNTLMDESRHLLKKWSEFADA
ncbi:MAG: extracellular solute-binding protein [Desulfobacterales bacterium]|nr:extracellular solute-binding protein [Desulfobacterales bacterium]